MDSNRSGAWAEYIACDSKTCKALNDSVNDNKRIFTLLQPLLALMIIDVTKKGNHNSIIQNDAASPVGKLTAKLCKDENIVCINIVREESQIHEMEEIGSSIIFRSDDANFIELLTGACQEYKPTCAFDRVGGKLTGDLVSQLKPGSEIFITNQLEELNLCGISPSDLIFSNKKLRGLSLKRWFEGLSTQQRFYLFENIENKQEIFGSNISDSFTISKFMDGILSIKEKQNKGITVLQIVHDSEEDNSVENLEVKDMEGFNLVIPQSPKNLNSSQFAEENIKENSESNQIVEEQEYLKSEIKTFESEIVQGFLKSLAKFVYDYDLNDGVQVEDVPYFKQLSDLSIYKGEWANNNPHGKGVRYYADGSIYEGY